MKIYILGKVTKKADLETEISQLGGKISTTLEQTVHLVIAEKSSFENLVEKKSEKLGKWE